MFSFRSLLRRRISFSPLQQPPTAAVSAAGDFSRGSSPAETHIFRGASRRSTGRWKPRRKPAADAPSRTAFLKQPAVHAPARVGACGRVSSSPVTGLHTQGRPTPSSRSTPPAVQPEPSLSTFWPFLPRPTPSVHLRRLQSISGAFSSSSVIFSSSSVVFSTVWISFFFIFKLHSRDSPSY